MFNLFRKTVGLALTVIGLVLTQDVLVFAQHDPVAATEYRAVLARYCVACHNERLKTAGLVLEQLEVATISENIEIWERVARRLRTRTMPPLGRPRPNRATYSAFAGWLETVLDQAAVERVPTTRTAVHRLNRTEYTNAVRDLLAITPNDVTDGALLPPDDTGYGFDNVAEVLSVSPLLLERYLSAAQKISRLAVGDVAMRPASRTYTVHKHARQDGRMTDNHPFGLRGGLAVRHYFPLDGEYLIKVNMLRTYTDRIRGLAEPHQLEIRLDGQLIKQFVTGGGLDTDGNPKTAEQRTKESQLGDTDLIVRFPSTAGPHVVSVGFLRRTLSPEGFLQPQFAVTSYTYAGDTNVLPSVSSIDIRGPYSSQGVGDTPSRRKIFICQPANTSTDNSCAHQILSVLARRAYRRPISNADLEVLLSFFEAGRAAAGFDSGIQQAIEKILVTPDFLFRFEPNTASALALQSNRKNLALASRLSFFLWSSIPDEELLTLAEQGRLSQPEILETQVRRMLADPRSNALVNNFVSQWLQLRNLRLASPDPYTFPYFDENLREASQREMELFLESQLRENRPVTDLLTADYTFVNERLAAHYNIPNVYGNHFRRVTLINPARWGLLGKASVLTVTSYPNRTSPVVRGKWLLENILGMPPPPPPPDVPDLEDPEPGKVSLSMRARMEQHRVNPTCASCHQVMDPLGFALENFDATGQWRFTTDGKTPIDTSGSLPNGTTFTGPVDFREALVGDHDTFMRTFTEKLFTYALGQGVGYGEYSAIRQILRQAAPHDYRWSSVILGIIKSEPFN